MVCRAAQKVCSVIPSVFGRHSTPLSGKQVDMNRRSSIFSRPAQTIYEPFFYWWMRRGPRDRHEVRPQGGDDAAVLRGRGQPPLGKRTLPRRQHAAGASRKPVVRKHFKHHTSVLRPCLLMEEASWLVVEGLSTLKETHRRCFVVSCLEAVFLPSFVIAIHD